MLQQIEKIADPLIKHKLFDSVKTAFETLTLHYTQEQIGKYRKIVRKFERKYQMGYSEFVNFTKEKAKKLLSDPTLHEAIIQLEDYAFDWKIADNGLKSWQQVHQEIVACLH